MLEKLFEEIYFEVKKQLHDFKVDKQIPVYTGNKDDNALLELGSMVTCIWVIATGSKIKIVNELIKNYKLPNGESTSINDWQKVIGNGIVVLADGTKQKAEIHWYQCRNLGKKEFKVKKWK